MFKSNLKVGSFSKVRIAGLLESGHLVGVAPGGARECLFDYDCQVLWKKRYNDPNNLIIQFLINVFMVHLLGLDSQRWRIWQKYQSSQFTQKISDWLTPPFHSHPPFHGEKSINVHHEKLVVSTQDNLRADKITISASLRWIPRHPPNSHRPPDICIKWRNSRAVADQTQVRILELL